MFKSVLSAAARRLGLEAPPATPRRSDSRAVLSIEPLEELAVLAPASITAGGYSQNFDSLASTGQSATLPTGWQLLETGISGTNAKYTADDGTTGGGNTYSYGAVGSSERALGSISNLNNVTTVTVGAEFVNNSGGAITELTIKLTEEQWRRGNFAAHSTTFGYSTDATSLTTGNWTGVSALNLTTINTNVGNNTALDGNDPDNQRFVAARITGLNIAAGGAFWIRWVDGPSTTGKGDGLAIDDFSITLSNGDVIPPTVEFDDGDVDDLAYVGQGLNYTATFSEDVDPATVGVDDFEILGGAATINSVTATADPKVFTIGVSPTTAGSLRLAVKSGSDVKDLAGNAILPGRDRDVLTILPAVSPISLTSAGYTQNFDSLASTGTSVTLPAGWEKAESKANANPTYTADDGNKSAGDTYSYGSGSDSDRALGSVFSSLQSSFGAAFVNDSGATITDLAISYTGEQWRLGDATHAAGLDRLNFQYSTDATSLTTGTWTNVNALDFNTIVTTGTVGLLNGNLAANRANVSGTITGLSLANGATIWIRWVDFNFDGGASPDDGLAVDDLSVSSPSLAAPTLVGIVDDVAGGPVEPGDPITYTITFSKDIDAATFTKDDLTNGGTAAVTIGDVTETSPGVFSVTVTPSGYGTIVLTIVEDAVITSANGVAVDTTSPLADDTTITVTDLTAPTLVSVADDVSGGPVESGDAITYTITFDEDIDAATFTAADLVNSGTASVSIGAVTETSAGVFSVTVTPTGQGTVILTIAQNAVVEDAYGNDLDTSVALPDDVTISVTDLTPPTLVSVTDDASGGPVEPGDPVTYTITFDEDIDESTFSAADLANAGTASVSIGAVAETSPGVFTVTMTPSGYGTIVLSIAAGASIDDAYGNALDASAALADDTTISVEDLTAPTVVSIADPGAGEYVVGAPIVFTITFDEAIDESTVAASDFANLGTASATIGPATRLSATVFTVTVTPTSTGTVLLSITGDVRDAADNALVVPTTDLDTLTVVDFSVPTGAGVVDDPVTGGKSLYIGGTNLADRINVALDSKGKNFTVTTRSGSAPTQKATFSAIGITRIIVDGKGAADVITVGTNVKIAAYIYGGEGDDKLYGGSGHDVLSGGAGNDLLVGRNGSDVLLGGLGKDRVDGSSSATRGGDLLVGDATTFDGVAQQAALWEIQKEWTGPAGYFDKIARLKTATGFSSVAFNVSNVADDGALDTIVGGKYGLNWYLDVVSATADKITKRAGEIVN